MFTKGVSKRFLAIASSPNPRPPEELLTCIIQDLRAETAAHA